MELKILSKKLILVTGLVIVAVVSIWFVFAESKKELTNYPPKGYVVVAYGDSLISGEGATAGNDLPALLSQSLGIPVANLGKPGDTTKDALLRISGAIDLKPDVVLLLLGGNDALRRTPISETEANLRTIVSVFQEAGAVTVLLGVRGGLLGDPYSEMYERIANDTGSAYITDVLDGIFGNGKYMSDGVHPNDEGYSIIARRVGPIVAKILNHKY